MGHDVSGMGSREQTRGTLQIKMQDSRADSSAQAQDLGTCVGTSRGTGTYMRTPGAYWRLDEGHTHPISCS